MALGPIEMLVVKFPGNRFSGEIIPALGELVENGTVRIVDLLFAVKNKEGDVKVLEFGDLDPDIFGQWDPLVSDVTPMLNEDDARELTASLENNSSAGDLALREHLGDALRRRGQQRPRRSGRQRAHPTRGRSGTDRRTDRDGVMISRMSKGGGPS